MGTRLTTKNNNKEFELKFDLFDHQKKTIIFMMKNHWSYIFNQPGTGKTECAVSCAMYQKLDGQSKKILIISTLSTLKNVWFNSITHHEFHELNPVVVVGTKIKKEKILKDNLHDTYIINPDALANLETLLLKIKWDMVIVDEATAFKNHTANRFKSLMKIIKKSCPKFFYLMTGTPTPNMPSDCFGLLKLFNYSQYPSFNRFRETVEREVRDFFWEALPDAWDTVNKLLQPSICFKKENVLTIANTCYEFIKFEMTKEQKDLFTEMKKEFILLMENGTSITAPHSAAKLNKMLQIIGGSLIDDNDNIIELDAQYKFEILKKILKEKKTNGKTIIYCSHKAQLDKIKESLKYLHCEIISGDTKQKDREQIFSDFQNTDKIDILVAIPNCMAHGITLTKADYIIYFNPIFSNEIYEQANARIARPGQKEIPHIFHLYCNNVDYAVFTKLQKRMSDQDYLLTMLSEE